MSFIIKCRFALIAIALLIYGSAALAAGEETFRPQADQFMADLTAEKYDSVAATFTPEVAAQLNAGMLKQVWTGVGAQLGGYKSHSYSKFIQADTVLTYIYLVQFKNMNLRALVSYNPAGKVNGFFFRPQEQEKTEKPKYRLPPYVDTTAFIETDFAAPGTPAVPASQVVPKGLGPAPVVLLVPGSGPLDRNETVLENQPFKDIAWGLGSNGIASVRFDNRSYIVGMDKTVELDLHSYLLDDIASLLAYIRSQPKIFDTTRIYLAGHSLGGIIAPLAARADGRLAGIIMISAPARTMTDVVIDQFEYLGSLEGDTAGSYVKTQIEMAKEACRKIKERTFPKDQMFIFASGRVWYDLLDNDNVTSAKMLTIPMLLLWGVRDYQVIDKDWEIWRTTLSGRANVTFKRYDDLNHLYQPGTGKATNTEYMTNSAPVDLRVIQDIAAWIKK